MVGVADEETAALRGQRADQLQLVLGQAEAGAIILGPRLGVGHEDAGRGLLDDRAADPAFERVTRRLGAEADDGVALAQQSARAPAAAGRGLSVQKSGLSPARHSAARSSVAAPGALR